MFYILRERDTSILTECVRFIHRNMSSKEYNKFDEWKDTLMENKDLFLENVIDILVNCTNGEIFDNRTITQIDRILLLLKVLFLFITLSNTFKEKKSFMN